jgi:hypothetical protein
VKLYGLPKKSTLAVVSALREYQANHSPTGTYGFLSTERIRADAGSQFTSNTFTKYCVQHGIKLRLTTPKKQYQNHLMERTWQTVTSTARSLLIHARLPDTFWYHALAYSTYIFKVLPVRGLRGEDTDVPPTPHELFFGTKPHIGHLQTFGCPVVICKWTASDKSNDKQTERGLRGYLHVKAYIEPLADNLHIMDRSGAIRCSERIWKPNPKYINIARAVAWSNVCEDTHLVNACAMEAHTTRLPSSTDAQSWEPAPKSILDITKLPEGLVRKEWLNSVKKRVKDPS